MRTATLAALVALALPTAATAASISADQAVKAYEAGKATGGQQDGYFAATCAGYWSEWTKPALENWKDPFVTALPDSMKSSDALKNQLHWQEQAVASVRAGKIQGAQAQAMLTTGRSMVSTSLAEDTPTALTRLFTQLGRCHVER